MPEKQENLTGGRRLARNVLWNLLGTGTPLLAALFAIPVLIDGLGLAVLRSASMRAIRAATDRPVSPAMRFSSCQNAASRLMEVAWPLIVTERLVIGRARRPRRAECRGMYRDG